MTEVELSRRALLTAAFESAERTHWDAVRKMTARLSDPVKPPQERRTQTSRTAADWLERRDGRREPSFITKGLTEVDLLGSCPAAVP